MIKALDWFKVQTQAFLADNPVEDTSEVVSEEQAPDIAEDLEQVVPVAEDEPVITEDSSPVQVLDPPVADPLNDELAVPQDPAPGVASGGSRRRTGSKRVTLADVMKQEAAKS